VLKNIQVQRRSNGLKVIKQPNIVVTAKWEKRDYLSVHISLVIALNLQMDKLANSLVIGNLPVILTPSLPITYLKFLPSSGNFANLFIIINVLIIMYLKVTHIT